MKRRAELAFLLPSHVNVPLAAGNGANCLARGGAFFENPKPYWGVQFCLRSGSLSGLSNATKWLGLCRPQRQSSQPEQSRADAAVWVVAIGA